MQPRLSEDVRQAYNAISLLYRGDEDTPEHHVAWTAELCQKLRPASDVLDLGCGCGVPVARDLATNGHKVTGVDISDVQITRARRLVPSGCFFRADATTVAFPDQSCDAIVCLYALIHMPLDAQPGLIARCSTWFRPGGWLLATTGHQAWTGSQANWLGGSATMWWSHADAATYRRWITDAGLEITEQRFVPEADSGHVLFWARRPST